MSARQALLALAVRAQRETDRVGGGRFAYVKTEGWYLSTAVSAEESRSAVIPVIRSQWIAEDGSGRIHTETGKPYVPSPAKRREWDGRSENGHGEADEIFAAGGLHMMWKMDSLSSDPAVLQGQLQRGHPAGPGNEELLTAIGDLYNEQPVRPQVRAALLRLLADVPALRYAGKTIDRAGRQGVAVTLDTDYGGLPSRLIFVFDPHTGKLLDREEMLTKSAGKLDVPIPCVISYTLYLNAARTMQLREPG